MNLERSDRPFSHFQVSQQQKSSYESTTNIYVFAFPLAQIAKEKLPNSVFKTFKKGKQIEPNA